MAIQEKNDSLQTLKAAIRGKTPGNFYIFHGEETFLLQHYLGQLHRVILDELTQSFNFHRFNSENFDLRDFADAVENLPMMAERTLVQVEDIDLFKFAEDTRNHFVEILSDIPEYCTLVFVYDTVEFKPDKRLKKLWEVVSRAEIVEFAKQSQRDLVSWISRHFAAKGKYISQELCVYLLELTDGTMTSLKGEIEKISAFSGAEAICRADIDAVTEPVLDAVVFRMTDHLGAKEYAKAMDTLQKLLKMQQEPIAILGAVGNYLRRLGTARVLYDRGAGAGELMKLYNMSDYAARKALAVARQFSPAFFKKAMDLVLETDRKMKTSYDEPTRLLELLTLQLAQEARNG
jgi:DNA polymerase-3 subunit delta